MNVLFRWFWVVVSALLIVASAALENWILLAVNIANLAVHSVIATVETTRDR